MKRLFCSLLTAFAFFCVAQNANAQLAMTNQTDKPVWVAVTYNFVEADADWSDNTWVSEGWLYIAPGDTTTVSRHIGFDRNDGIKTNFFYYAFQPDGREWKGIRKFVVEDPTDLDALDKERFEYRIPRAHKEATLTKKPNYVRRLFKGGTLGKNPYEVITLRANDLDDTPEGEDEFRH